MRKVYAKESSQKEALYTKSPLQSPLDLDLGYAPLAFYERATGERQMVRGVLHLIAPPRIVSIPDVLLLLP